MVKKKKVVVTRMRLRRRKKKVVVEKHQKMIKQKTIEGVEGCLHGDDQGVVNQAMPM